MQEDQPTVPVVFSCSDGDAEVAWVSATSEKVQVRRFRAHLGHVVEVMAPGGRLVRVGPGLVRPGCLRLQGSLIATINDALDAAEASRSLMTPTPERGAQPLEQAVAAGSDARATTPWWRPSWLKLPKQVAPLLTTRIL